MRDEVAEDDDAHARQRAQMITVVELLERAITMRSTIPAAVNALMREGKLPAPKYNPSGSDGNASAKMITRAQNEREHWCRQLHQKPGEAVACVYQECLAHAAKAAREALARATPRKHQRGPRP